MSWKRNWKVVARRRLLTALLVGWMVCSTVGIRADETVATVNGQAIPAAELDFLYLVRRVPEDQRSALRERFVSDLIDQRLMSEFLATQGVEATPEELDARIASVREMIAQGGQPPGDVLQQLGVTDDMLRKTLALPLAWNRFARLAVTDEQLQEYFSVHRRRFDGTRRRISQIVLTLPIEADDAATMAALSQLQSIRDEIAAGKTTFADAAKAHSQSPSKEQGGDVGWVVYGTRLPREIADVAFELPVETLGQPFRSRFGVHMLQVTAEEPGDLSLEDVRGEVLAAMGRTLWDDQLRQQRAAAKIERP